MLFPTCTALGNIFNLKKREPKPPRKAQAGPEPAEQEGSANLKSSIGVLGSVQVLGLFVGLSPSSRSRNSITRFTRSWTWLCYLFGRVSFTNLHIHNFQQQRAVCPVVVEVISYPLATMDASKPIAFCEHLQLSSLGVQPASISFQVRWRDIELLTCVHWLSLNFVGLPLGMVLSMF